MHTFACPFFELILRVRDMSSGTFLVGPGIVTVPFFWPFSESEFWLAALKFSANASNIMDLSMVLRFGSSRSYGASPGGCPGLDLKHSSFALCGAFSSFSTSEYLSCGMKHAELF